jgi:hypothetical protein
MLDYGRASDDYIKNIINKDLYEQLYTPCFNLSCALGDVDGKVYTGIMTQVLTGLDIVSPGVLVLGETGIEPPSSILIEQPYNTQTSRAAFDLFVLLKASDPTIVTTLEEAADIQPVSLMVSYADSMAPAIRNAVNTLYLECLALYRELLVASLDNPVTMTKEDVSRVVTNIRWLSTKLEAVNPKPYSLIEAVRDVQITLSYILSIRGVFRTVDTDMMAELSELSDSVTSLSDRYTLKQYIVQDGDTIHRVAQKMLGSAEKAIDVIEFNKLSYPFIQSLQDTRLPNTVTMGDTLWIPEFTSEQSDNTDLSYLGGDLMLVDRDLSGGDLQEDTYGDLQIVENLDSLVQDLKSRLQIEIGTMLFHPLYGNKLQRIVGQKGNPEWEQLARLEATSMFLSDDRIQNVESLIVTRIQGGISVDAVLEVAGSATPVPFSSYLKEDDYHGFAD